MHRPRGKKLLTVAALLAALVVVSLAGRSLMAKKPSHLGGPRDSLAPCPALPNCVSSLAADTAHRVEPLPLAGSSETTMRLLREILEGMPRTRIVTASSSYLHAECRSRLFGFVDDLELLVDEKGKVVHLRSASRTGTSDLGTNRRRVETLRRRVEERRSDS